MKQVYDFPSYVDIEVTSRCNLNCEFCFGPARDNTFPEAPLEKWMWVVEKIASRNAKGICISGGEPTLYKGLIDLIKYARKFGLHVNLSTNGLNSDIIQECAPLISSIGLPADGFSARTQAKMRNSCWGINEAMILVDKIKSINKNITIKIGTVATMVNFDEIKHIGYNINWGNIDIWKIYQFVARRNANRHASKYNIDNSMFNIIRMEVSRRFMFNTDKIIFYDINDRRRAYLFIYCDGIVGVPNVGPNLEDILLGNMFIDGDVVLDNIHGCDFIKNRENYETSHCGCAENGGEDGS